MVIWMHIFIILYLLILSAERIQSLVRSGKKKVLLTDGLHKYMTGLCLLSFAGTIVLLCIQGFFLLQGAPIDSPQAIVNDPVVSTMLLCSTIGCLLLSGMVHTEYSIPAIQFVSYGALIVAMILNVITQSWLTPGARVLTMLYIVAFSMAIPVVYPSQIKNKRLFHIIESIVSFGLVAVFTFMLFELFMGQYGLVFHPAFLITAVLADIVVLVLRWKEEINWFVLVSLALAVVLWIVGAIAGMLG